jgi:hypothetical protein
MSERRAAVEEAVPHFLRAVDPEVLMAHVARICAYDRYQASHGIEHAAALVAEEAAASGLDDVQVVRFPADGGTRWWSFDAPLAWTPVTARLTVRSPRESFVVDHARQPFAVATHSAPTPAGGVTTRLVDVPSPMAAREATGAVAVMPEGAPALADVSAALASSGALGLAAAAASAGERSHRGRIELDPRTSLFGFSLTAPELALLQKLTGEDAVVHAEVAIDRGAEMPIVTAVLPGTGSLAHEEVWLIAHLCHPRPSANDNASGVAALLGIGTALAAARRADSAWGTARTIRFVWGPEIVGTAAVLHGAPRPPTAVINLDMVGEDQRRCGGPLLVERNPDCRPGLVAPAAEAIVAEVFARTSASAGDATWRAVPFAGFSDHALFAGPHLGAPAVQLCHSPDRFNHSAADAPDKVSRQELARSTAVGAALALLLASEPAVARPVLASALAAWCAREETAAQHAPAGGPEWTARHIDYLRRRARLLHAQLGGAPSQAPDAGLPSRPGEPRIDAAWEGPFNARALLTELARRGGGSAALAARIRAERSLHALLANVASRCDGTRSAAQIAAETSFALGRRLPSGLVRQLTHALLAAGWAKAVPEAGVPTAR